MTSQIEIETSKQTHTLFTIHGIEKVALYYHTHKFKSNKTPCKPSEIKSDTFNSNPASFFSKNIINSNYLSHKVNLINHHRPQNETSNRRLSEDLEDPTKKNTIPLTKMNTSSSLHPEQR